MTIICILLLLLSVCTVPALASEAPVLDIVSTVPTEATASVIAEDVPSLYAVSGDLSGGYYFVCDSQLGSSVKFYVPLEWAHDVFSLDASGAPVNMSNTTCYAYCPDFPEYTISCSRFGTFVYRVDGYNTSDLNVSNISDTNIDFMEDSSRHLSDSDMLLLIAVLVFLFFVYTIISRR